MSDLYDLYQGVILEHNKRPRNFRVIEHAQKALGNNPLCGDKVSVFVTTDAAGETIEELSFKGEGCAICMASTSIMTERLKGAKISEAKAIHEAFHTLVTTGELSDDPDLGKLEVFAGVSEFPVRVKCASLGWHTLQAALVNKGEVSTEA